MVGQRRKYWYERVDWKNVAIATYVAGTLCFAAYKGSYAAIDDYVREQDEPEILAESVIRYERLRDGRIHVYKRVEEHKYVVPQYLVDPRPQKKPAPDTQSSPDEKEEALEEMLESPGVEG